MVLIQKEIKKITMFVNEIQHDCLCFIANTAGSTVRLVRNGSAPSINIETSTDGITFTAVALNTTFTLDNVGDKLYIRNRNETVQTITTSRENYYGFQLTGSLNCSGDPSYLLCKYGTKTATDFGLCKLFYGCTSLVTAPLLPFTTLTRYCYYQMFYGCTNLETIPAVPALNVSTAGYESMFEGCSKIKISETQTGEYINEYRIPTEGAGTRSATDALDDMFTNTGGTFAGTPTLNTSYYTSNTIVNTNTPSPTAITVFTEKQIRPNSISGSTPLCFIANQNNSTVRLAKNGSPTSVTLETSTDGINWTGYTLNSTITLTNIGDKVYIRNTSETTTGFSKGQSSYYCFVLTGSLFCTGDVTSLINKNCTDTLNGNYCFYRLFYYESNSSVLKSAPELPATTLTNYCYYQMFTYNTQLTIIPKLPATTLKEGCYYNMFSNCTFLKTLPELPATTLVTNCYRNMFYNCSSIALSTTQTGEYQTPYRIPIEGTGATGSNSLTTMFGNTGGSFTGTPTINQTYYTSCLIS